MRCAATYVAMQRVLRRSARVACGATERKRSSRATGDGVGGSGMQTGIAQSPAQPTSTRRRSKTADREARWGWFFIAPWIVGFIIFTAFPVVASLFLSFNQY